MCPCSGFHGSGSDGISPLHPYYFRDYRSTSHIKRSSRRTGVFSRGPGVCFECCSDSKRVFQIHEKHGFSPRMGQTKTVYAPHPVSIPYSAHILWKLMICWPNESLRYILCGKKYVQIMYRSINKSKICPKWAQAIDSMGWIQTAYLLCTRITLETTALRVT